MLNHDGKVTIKTIKTINMKRGSFGALELLLVSFFLFSFFLFLKRGPKKIKKIRDREILQTQSFRGKDPPHHINRDLIY